MVRNKHCRHCQPIPVPSKALQAKSESIGLAVDSLAASVQHMGVDHRRAHIFVPEQLLDCPDIIPTLQEVGRKGVAKRKMKMGRCLILQDPNK